MPSPLELVDRIAALVPPPRTHRHRCFGVLGRNSPLRAAVTAMALAAQAQPATTQAEPAESVPPKHSPAHYLWAVLIARIYEVFPLLCPRCGGQMRLIAFITEGAQIRKILDHIGVDCEPPRIAPARGPPQSEESDAPMDEGEEVEPGWDQAGNLLSWCNQHQKSPFSQIWV
jgi:Putative transposase